MNDFWTEGFRQQASQDIWINTVIDQDSPVNDSTDGWKFHGTTELTLVGRSADHSIVIYIAAKVLLQHFKQPELNPS